MSKRLSIMIDDDIDKKLRNRQAKAMITTNKNYTISKCANDVLRAGLRVEKKDD